MKILMINDSYSNIGGVNNYIENLTILLKKEGHDVFWFSLSENIELDKENIKVIKYDHQNRFQWFISENLIDRKIYLELRRYILSIKPDIIHFHNIYKASKTILLASRGFKKVQTVHDFGVICPLRTLTIEEKKFKVCKGKKGLRCYLNGCLKFRTNLLDYTLFSDLFFKKRLIDIFICPSKILTKIVKGKRLGKVYYLPHFCDFSFKTTNSKKSNNILFVGRISKEKGLYYLLNSFKIILKKESRLKLIIVGDGPEKSILKKVSDRYGISKSIIFEGFVNNNRLTKYFEDCFVVVIPSIWMENSPLVAYEAMYHRKPIIASNIGGLPDLVKDNYNGFLIDRFDVRGMAKKIIYLKKNEKIAKRMGINGRNILKEQFSKEKQIKSLIKIYESVLNIN